MQSYELTQAFREWEVGMRFKKHDDGDWSSVGEIEKQPSHTLDTLLDVGGYLEEMEDNFTPSNGGTFFHITGAGEVKSREWTGSAFCTNCQNFMGVFETHEDAMTRLEEIRSLINNGQDSF